MPAKLDFSTLDLSSFWEEVTWSTGNITEQMIEEYLEHHRDPSNNDIGNMMLE